MTDYRQAIRDEILKREKDGKAIWEIAADIDFIVRVQVSKEIQDYSKSHNMADVGTQSERCLCDASICIHEGFSMASNIARGKK